jgi:sulfoxide reductase heme-binding subunit YedZ
VPLAATSTDAMVRRLGGRNWRRLQQVSYGIVVLAMIHYFMQLRLLVDDESIVMGGLYLWLMGYRLAAWLGGPVSPVRLVGLGVAAAGLTALGEAGFFWLNRAVDPVRVLAANLSTDIGIRPAVFVLGITLAIATVAVLRVAPRPIAQPAAREA